MTTKFTIFQLYTYALFVRMRRGLLIEVVWYFEQEYHAERYTAAYEWQWNGTHWLVV